MILYFYSYPSPRDSIPDLTIHENGRGVPARSRDLPEDQPPPQTHQQNGRTHPQHNIDNIRHSFPPDVKLHQKRTSHQHPENNLLNGYVATDRIRDSSVHELRSSDSYLHGRRTSDDQYPPQELHQKQIPQQQQRNQQRHDASTREMSQTHHLQRHLSSDQDTRNSSSSGDQRYLEQSEISQRPESITPEQTHRIRTVYPESDSEVEDLMRVPTVSFLLTERGEPIEIHPVEGKHMIKTSRDRKGTKLLPMEPISSAPKSLKASLKAKSVDTISEEPKMKLLQKERVSIEEQKETYIFGGKPKLSSNRSLDIEAGKVTRFEDTPSPESLHWRYDSRDANYLRYERQHPSSPSDPGFVRHTAHNWPESAPRTPSPSLTGPIRTMGERLQNWPSSRSKTPSQSPQSAMQSPVSSQRVQWSPQQSSDEGDYAMAIPPQMPSKPPVSEHKEKQKTEQHEDEEVPSGGSLTTQLLQKWLKQRKTKISKTKSEP
ncbi:hypothetical protein L9F63_018111 [Diploptera punctata]|uniref:Uncharacterized protein n=1 Tax=Diploptera punctata TaxID=6984 RepID=A0AAD7ZX61_DIPPU|nr:hypothetical protein L9F63_018111 [Diploptera punctata]